MSDNDPIELLESLIKDPKHYGRVEGPTITCVGKNRLCGDELILTLALENDRISRIGFEHKGCVLSKAGAALITMLSEGALLKEVQGFEDNLILEKLSLSIELRKACALLGLRALKQALANYQESGQRLTEFVLEN